MSFGFRTIFTGCPLTHGGSQLLPGARTSSAVAEQFGPLLHGLPGVFVYLLQPGPVLPAEQRLVG